LYPGVAVIKINDTTYAHKDSIAKVELFPATLLIKVTLFDGTVCERFVSEERIEYYVSGQAHRDTLERLTQRYPDIARTIVEPIYTRERAFEIEAWHFMKDMK
jgi:hypothetical protein